jgi:hypothetical protein
MSADTLRTSIEQAIARGWNDMRICTDLHVTPKAVRDTRRYLELVNSERDTRGDGAA